LSVNVLIPVLNSKIRAFIRFNAKVIILVPLKWLLVIGYW